jgi:hypothetical protein
MTQEEKVQASMTSVERSVSGCNRINWAPGCHVLVILEQGERGAGPVSGEWYAQMTISYMLSGPGETMVAICRYRPQ